MSSCSSSRLSTGYERTRARYVPTSPLCKSAIVDSEPARKRRSRERLRGPSCRSCGRGAIRTPCNTTWTNEQVRLEGLSDRGWERLSDLERRTAAAGRAHVRIPELETRAVGALDVVDFRLIE